MITKKDLKQKYQKLPRKEKELIGSALVKVNLGVSLPIDQRRAAEFLKGSIFIAKSECLDEVIQLLHDDQVNEKPNSKKEEVLVSAVNEVFPEDEMVQTMRDYKEDSVITNKDKLK